MKFFPHNLKDDERCYVTVRVCNAEHTALREWMRTHPEQPCVSFVHGVRLERRSMGWYRLNPSNTFRGAEKLKSAFALLRKFAHEYQRKLAEEERRKQLLSAKPELRVAAFVSGNQLGGGEYHVRNFDTKPALPTVAPSAPASINRLLALQQHFRR